MRQLIRGLYLAHCP